MPKEENARQSKIALDSALQSKSPDSTQNNTLEARVTQAKTPPITIPIHILSSNTPPATAIAHYLKEKHALTIADIARALNRDHRTIWTLLNRNKNEQTAPTPTATHHIPLALFCDRKLSILEHTVKHLRTQGHTIRTIAQLLNKHPSTISTCSTRAKRKHP